MASGNDMRFGAARESAFGTRVAPTRFFEVTGEDVNYAYAYYNSRGLGAGRWNRKRARTTSSGDGNFEMEVPTVGFGFWLDLLHPNAVTPVQQAATPAYLQTHVLDGPVSKSASIQVQKPPVTSTTLLPDDLVGVMVSAVTFSWGPGGVLMFQPTLVVRELKTDQALATFTPPATSGMFGFQGGSLTIGGTLVADLTGDGSITLSWPLRDDAFPLGSGGLMNKPVETDKPTSSGSAVADFNNQNELNRVVNGTIADVVLLFEGATISGAHKETIQVTLPDQGFTTPRANVGGPGPVSQTISWENASQTNDAPVILYKSTDIAV